MLNVQQIQQQIQQLQQQLAQAQQQGGTQAPSAAPPSMGGMRHTRARLGEPSDVQKRMRGLRPGAMQRIQEYYSQMAAGNEPVQEAGYQPTPVLGARQRASTGSGRRTRGGIRGNAAGYRSGGNAAGYRSGGNAAGYRSGGNAAGYRSSGIAAGYRSSGRRRQSRSSGGSSGFSGGGGSNAFGGSYSTPTAGSSAASRFNSYIQNLR